MLKIIFIDLIKRSLIIQNYLYYLVFLSSRFLVLLSTVSRIALSRSLRWLTQLLHLIPHLKPVVAQLLHSWLHHLLLLRVWHANSTLRHTHLSRMSTLSHHSHLLLMMLHLHIHTLNLDAQSHPISWINLTLTIN